MPANIGTATLGVKADLTPFERQIRQIESRTINLNFNSARPLGRLTGDVAEFEKSMSAANARVIAFGASAAIIGGVATALHSMVTESIAVEKALTSINATLGASQSQLARFSEDLFSVAKNTESSFASVAKAAEEFSHQGLSIAEVLRRTSDAMTLVRTSGLPVIEVVKSLTTTVNAFNQEALTTTQVADRLTAVSSRFGVGMRDLTEALAGVGTSAEQAQVPFNDLIGLITRVQQVSGKGGQEIGQAFRTIFARVQKEDTLKALSDLGVAVKTVGGNTLPTIDILSRLTQTYDKLGDSQKEQVAELLGGVRQISTLKVALNDLNSQYSVYRNVVDAANHSTGEAARRQSELNTTISSQANEALNNLKKLAAGAGSLVFGPTIKNILGAVNSGSDSLEGDSIGKKLGEGILRGIGGVLSGPGLVAGGVLAARLLKSFGDFALKAAGNVLEIGKASEKEIQVRAGITDLLRQSPGLYNEILAKARSLTDIEESTLVAIKEQAAAREAADRFVNSAASGLTRRGVRFESGRGSFTGVEEAEAEAKTLAGGYVPDLIASGGQKEIEEAGRNGYSVQPSQIRSMVARIDGKPTNVVYNSREKVIQNFANTGEPAIIPPGKTLESLMLQRINGAKGFIPNLVDINLKLPSAFGAIGAEAVPIQKFSLGSFLQQALRGEYEKTGNRRTDNYGVPGLTNEMLNSVKFTAKTKTGILSELAEKKNAPEKVKKAYSTYQKYIDNYQRDHGVAPSNEEQGEFLEKAIGSAYGIERFSFNTARFDIRKRLNVSEKNFDELAKDFGLGKGARTVDLKRTYGYDRVNANFVAKATYGSSQANGVYKSIVDSIDTLVPQGLPASSAQELKELMTFTRRRTQNSEAYRLSGVGTTSKIDYFKKGGLGALSKLERVKYIAEGFVPNFLPNAALQREFLEEFQNKKRTPLPEHEQLRDYTGKKKLESFSGRESFAALKSPTTVSGSINAVLNRTADDDVQRRQLLRLTKGFDYAVERDFTPRSFAGELSDNRFSRKVSKDDIYRDSLREYSSKRRRENIDRYLDYRKERTAQDTSYLFRGVSEDEITSLRRLGQTTSLGGSNADGNLGSYITSSFGKAAGFGLAATGEGGRTGGYVLALDKGRVLNRAFEKSQYGTEERNSLKIGRIERDDVLHVIDLKTRQLRSLDEFSRKNDSIGSNRIPLSKIRSQFYDRERQYSRNYLSPRKVKESLIASAEANISSYRSAIDTGKVFGRPLSADQMEMFKKELAEYKESILPQNIDRNVQKEIQFRKTDRRAGLANAVEAASVDQKQDPTRRLRKILSLDDRSILSSRIEKQFATGFIPNFALPFSQEQLSLARRLAGRISDFPLDERQQLINSAVGNTLNFGPSETRDFGLHLDLPSQVGAILAPRAYKEAVGHLRGSERGFSVIEKTPTISPIAVKAFQAGDTFFGDPAESARIGSVSPFRSRADIEQYLIKNVKGEGLSQLAKRLRSVPNPAGRGNLKDGFDLSVTSHNLPVIDITKTALADDYFKGAARLDPETSSNANYGKVVNDVVTKAVNARIGDRNPNASLELPSVDSDFVEKILGIKTNYAPVGFDAKSSIDPYGNTIRSLLKKGNRSRAGLDVFQEHLDEAILGKGVSSREFKGLSDLLRRSTETFKLAGHGYVPNLAKFVSENAANNKTRGIDFGDTTLSTIKSIGGKSGFTLQKNNTGSYLNFSKKGKALDIGFIKSNSKGEGTEMFSALAKFAKKRGFVISSGSLVAQGEGGSGSSSAKTLTGENLYEQYPQLKIREKLGLHKTSGSISYDNPNYRPDDEYDPEDEGRYRSRARRPSYRDSRDPEYDDFDETELARETLNFRDLSHLRSLVEGNHLENAEISGLRTLLAKGYVPNFAADSHQVSGLDAVSNGLVDSIGGLKDSIRRETTNTGVSLSQVRVNFSDKSGLPGISVTNTRDEGFRADPQIGFDRVRRAGGNIFAAGSGKEFARGFIPNLAEDPLDYLSAPYPSDIPGSGPIHQFREVKPKPKRVKQPEVPNTIEEDQARIADTERRQARRQHAGFAVSIAAPLLAGGIASSLSDPGSQHLVEGIGSAVGTGAAIASFGGPAGAIAGIGIAAVQVTKSINDSLRPSFEDLAKQAQELSTKNEQQIRSASGVLQAQSNLEEANKTGNASQIRIANSQYNLALAGVTDSGLKSKLTNAKSVDDKGKVLSEYQINAQEQSFASDARTNTAAFRDKYSSGVFDSYLGNTVGTRHQKINEESIGEVEKIAQLLVSSGDKGKSVEGDIKKDLDPQFVQLFDTIVAGLRQSRQATEDLSKATQDYQVEVAGLNTALAKLSIAQNFRKDLRNVQVESAYQTDTNRVRNLTSLNDPYLLDSAKAQLNYQSSTQENQHTYNRDFSELNRSLQSVFESTRTANLSSINSADLRNIQQRVSTQGGQPTLADIKELIDKSSTDSKRVEQTQEYNKLVLQAEQIKATRSTGDTNAKDDLAAALKKVLQERNANFLGGSLQPYDTSDIAAGARANASASSRYYQENRTYELRNRVSVGRRDLRVNDFQRELNYAQRESPSYGAVGELYQGRFATTDPEAISRASAAKRFYDAGLGPTSGKAYENARETYRQGVEVSQRGVLADNAQNNIAAYLDSAKLNDKSIGAIKDAIGSRDPALVDKAISQVSSYNSNTANQGGRYGQAIGATNNIVEELKTLRENLGRTKDTSAEVTNRTFKTDDIPKEISDLNTKISTDLQNESTQFADLINQAEAIARNTNSIDTTIKQLAELSESQRKVTDASDNKQKNEILISDKKSQNAENLSGIANSEKNKVLFSQRVDSGEFKTSLQKLTGGTEVGDPSGLINAAYQDAVSDFSGGVKGGTSKPELIHQLTKKLHSRLGKVSGITIDEEKIGELVNSDPQLSQIYDKGQVSTRNKTITDNNAEIDRLSKNRESLNVTLDKAKKDQADISAKVTANDSIILPTSGAIKSAPLIPDTKATVDDSKPKVAPTQPSLPQPRSTNEYAYPENSIYSPLGRGDGSIHDPYTIGNRKHGDAIDNLQSAVFGSQVLGKEGHLSKSQIDFTDSFRKAAVSEANDSHDPLEKDLVNKLISTIEDLKNSISNKPNNESGGSNSSTGATTNNTVQVDLALSVPNGQDADSWKAFVNQAIYSALQNFTPGKAQTPIF